MGGEKDCLRFLKRAANDASEILDKPCLFPSENFVNYCVVLYYASSSSGRSGF